METDPQTISAYLIYLSQHAPVEEQASHNDLALVIQAPRFPRSRFLHMLQWRHKSDPLSPAAGRGAAHRGAFHHHEQPVLQTLLPARVRRRAQRLPHHLFHVHQEDEED